MTNNWIKTIENENMMVWECNGWSIRKEYRRRNGKCEVFYYVSNDDREYSRGYRNFYAAADFAEKHFN